MDTEKTPTPDYPDRWTEPTPLAAAYATVAFFRMLIERRLGRREHPRNDEAALRTLTA